MSLSERYREATRLAVEIETLNQMLTEIRQDRSSKRIAGKIHHWRPPDCGVQVFMPRATALRILLLTLADKQVHLAGINKGLSK